MNLERRAWIISRLLVILLMLVALQVGYWQLWRGMALQPVVLDPVAASREYARLRGDPLPGDAQAGRLTDLPQPVIQRTVQMLSTIERGAIYDRRGSLLVQDNGSPENYTRVYADPSLAHLTGYASALRTGVSGLEATYNTDLLGLNRPDTQIDRILRRPIRGSSLVLTIDSEIQRAAADALGGWPGAVVVLDGKTGAVLAMVSAPTYDPNRINQQAYYASLNSGELLNRATQAVYIPGSTFKTVTLIAALDTGLVQPDAVFDFGEPRTRPDGRIYYVYEVDGGQIPDPNHRERILDLPSSFAVSANAAFAKLADDLGGDTMIEYSQRLGFSTPDYTRRFPLELPVRVPQLANDLDSIRTNNLLRAATGMGQGELLSTPLNMAMVVQAVINDGQIPVPYMVESIRDPQGRLISDRPNRHLVRGVMRAETARIVKGMMTNLVDEILGGQGLVPNAVSGGKTGTAQLGGNQDPHSWFIGFSERGEHTVVIAVITEHGGSGAKQAVPVFAQVARAALDILEGEE
jgi:penicillin-binding protein A